MIDTVVGSPIIAQISRCIAATLCLLACYHIFGDINPTLCNVVMLCCHGYAQLIKASKDVYHVDVPLLFP